MSSYVSGSNVGRRWVWRDGKMIEVDPDWRPKPRAFFVHTDAIAPIQHPITGQLMDSKSAFRQVTKDHGYIEVGNERPKFKDPVEEHFESREYDEKLTADLQRSFEESGCEVID